MPNWYDIPALVRHSTLAIYNKSTGGGAEGFIKALRISRDTLAKQGYLYSAPGLAVLQDIQLTGKGWIRNRIHETEGQSGGAKDAQFSGLWKMIESRMAELDGPSGKKNEPPEGQADAAQQERKQSKPGENEKADNKRGSVYPPPK